MLGVCGCMWACMCEPNCRLEKLEIRMYVGTYVGVCGRMWVYVGCMLAYVGVCWRMLAYVTYDP
jgi:hypothetical protein